MRSGNGVTQEEQPPGIETPDDRDAYQPVFVIGCPRSGTTWVQLLLSRHPNVATAPETQIFAFYLDWFRKQWRHEHEGPGRRHQGRVGLSRLLDEPEFDELCRRSARFVLDRIHRENPGASLVVEKSPRHALLVGWIHRLFPDARFLHVLRDPRDTAASIMAAGRSWGVWAPRGPVGAARLWERHVRAALEAAEYGNLYREIRYESLQEDPVGELGRLHAWLGLEAGREACEQAVEACRLERLRSTPGEAAPIPGERSPRGFFRKGQSGGWRDDLSRGQATVIERVCGSLMEQTGYERMGSSRAGLARLRIAAYSGLERARDGLRWRLNRIMRLI